MNTWLRRITHFTYRAAFYLLAIALLIYVVRAVDSRRNPDLLPWHTTELNQEFTAGMKAVTNWHEYLSLETRLFEQLEERIIQQVPESEAVRYNRFYSQSHMNPTRFPVNWNRSFEMRPRDEPVGVAILVHGLSDSPYSVRSTAETLLAEGYFVIAPRMPGHGTAPSGLLAASWKDWSAVVQLAVAYGVQVIGENKELIVGGYSNGAALTLNYTLDAMNDDSLPVPDRLVLLSPAIAITAFARVTSWHKMLSWMPYFEKFKWLDILPEYDPYKYNSFPKNAGYQNFTLTLENQDKLERLQASGRMSEFPPVITFQSVVDATVHASAIFDGLYDRLDNNASELVLFDINRSHVMSAFIKDSPDLLQTHFENPVEFAYDFTGVSNSTVDTEQVSAFTRPVGDKNISVCELVLHWPREVFSLSHTAIPFRLDDPFYGNQPDSKNALSRISPRGERGVLRISLNMFARLRYNPFYSYQDWRLRRFINKARNIMPLCPIEDDVQNLPASS